MSSTGACACFGQDFAAKLLGSLCILCLTDIPYINHHFSWHVAFAKCRAYNTSIYDLYSFDLHLFNQNKNKNEPHHEKTNNVVSELYKHKRWLEAGNF